MVGLHPRARRSPWPSPSSTATSSARRRAPTRGSSARACGASPRRRPRSRSGSPSRRSSSSSRPRARWSVATAFTAAKWSGLGLIALYGYFGGQLSGRSVPASILHALAVGLIGGFLIALQGPAALRMRCFSARNSSSSRVPESCRRPSRSSCSRRSSCAAPRRRCRACGPVRAPAPWRPRSPTAGPRPSRGPAARGRAARPPCGRRRGTRWPVLRRRPSKPIAIRIASRMAVTGLRVAGVGAHHRMPMTRSSSEAAVGEPGLAQVGRQEAPDRGGGARWGPPGARRATSGRRSRSWTRRSRAAASWRPSRSPRSRVRRPRCGRASRPRCRRAPRSRRARARRRR